MSVPLRAFIAFLLLLYFGWAGGLAPACAATTHEEAAIRCLDCHVSVPLPGVAHRYYEDIHRLCLQCHENYSCLHDQAGKAVVHPVGITPQRKIAADLPLEGGRSIGCITCHVFHEGGATANPYPHRLRRQAGPAFCASCHENPVAR